MGVLRVSTDITQLQRYADNITDLLRDKELVLKEVHHGIKNNMGTIISLLALQADAIDDPKANRAPNDSVGRVRSMMVLYDKLYQGCDYSAMQVLAYLSPLVDEIVANSPSRHPVRIIKRLGDFELDVKVPQSLRIMVNELITNAMKYAFDGIESPELAIEARPGNCVERYAKSGRMGRRWYLNSRARGGIQSL
ncbi:MAG: sensor histidine kinase [Spirochaetota bacterium]